MSSQLSEMTWPEVAHAVAGGATTVILPLGATEQHGPHLPLGTDTFRAAALAERLGASMPGVLVAPTLPIGCSDEHQGFAGLLSLGHTTLAGVLIDCARCMTSWGVRRLALLSAHGGNGRALELAVERITEDLPALSVVVLGSSPTLDEAILTLAATDGIAAESVGLHAGEGETSEMLALRPDLVRLERAEPGHQGRGPVLLSRLRQIGLKGITPTGTLGDGRPAEAGRGARYLEVQIDSFRRELRDEADASGAPPI